MTDRRIRSRALREQTALKAFERPHFPQLPSGEEGAYVYGGELSYAGSFTKGLPHDPQTGLVSPAAFRALVHAITTTQDDDFALVPYGAPAANARPWVNPTAGAAFDMEGPDAGALSIPPAPPATGPEVAAEMAELYWMALLRDLKFSEIEAGMDAKVTDAVDSLNDLEWFQGSPGTPVGADRKRPPVTPQSLFRGVTAGDEVGPYVSQFLLMGTNTLPHRGATPVLADFQDGRITYGAITIDQRVTPAKTGVDYMTSFADWIKIQNGERPAMMDQFETPRLIATPRDLATYVHFDALYEAYLNACLILLEIGAPRNPGLPFDSASSRQEGFGTFGGPHVLSLVTEVATRALKCVWRQKWMVHRRARPEAVGGLLECHRLKPSGPVPFIEPVAECLDDAGVLPAVLAAKGSHLLPMAFPEGSPMHPSYGAGHATVAGACVTILKAFFDESHKLPFAFQANPADNGATLEHLPAFDDTLTVGGELNKVCSNISIGRNMAGVHYFTDYIESIRLGEKVACAILEEQAVCYPEDFSMTFSSFDRAADGSPIDITIEKTGDTVVKRQQVRPMTVPASPAIVSIAAE
jgi:hypothetical protein